jgi:hypothetical protein
MTSKIKLIVAAAFVILASCNKQLSPLLNDPSAASPSSADPDLYLSNMQVEFKTFYKDATDFGEQMVRMQTMFGPTYYNAFTPSNFDEVWQKAYMSVFKTANTMIPIAEEKSEYMHAGIAQVLKAYTMMTLVDLFGDVPYSEANQGLENPNPKLDAGKAVYDSAIALLDAAIANFAKKSSFSPANDLFYGDKQEPAPYWTSLAKTLKLKAYITIRLADNTAAAKISALLVEDDLINTADQDFVFSYSTHSTAPDARASHYINNYGSDNAAQDYIGTYFLWSLVEEKPMFDPRTPYYVYRQLDSISIDGRVASQTTRQFAIPCLYRSSPYPAGTCYCLVGEGYWGRDHGNNEGIPPDNALRTTWGVYPAGGAFDAEQNTAIGQGSDRVTGAGGNGINPIWLSSFTNFVKAEAALTLGTAGNPKTLMLAGIDASMNKVANFSSSIGYSLPTSDTSYLITDHKIYKYDSIVSKQYDAATSTDAKLNIIEKEYYLAAWGNGIEPYNTYRRTGKPANLQPTLGPTPGSFIRSFFYASVYVNYNKNATQKAVVNQKVFWDTNPDNFVR